MIFEFTEENNDFAVKLDDTVNAIQFVSKENSQTDFHEITVFYREGDHTFIFESLDSARSVYKEMVIQWRRDCY